MIYEEGVAAYAHLIAAARVGAIGGQYHPTPAPLRAWAGSLSDDERDEAIRAANDRADRLMHAFVTEHLRAMRRLIGGAA